MTAAPIYITPIIFSAAMINALLNDSKSQTRRLVTSQWANLKMHHELGERCFVWVREAYSPRIKPEEATDGIGRAWYKADSDWSGEIRWKPSIHMPRWASRLTHEVTDVRLQRLQDISEANAVSEGVEPLFDPITAKSRPEFDMNPMPFRNYLWHGHIGRTITGKQSDDWEYQYSSYTDPRESYSSLWELLHGKGSWDSNHEVIAISFRVHQQNIDALLASLGAV